MQRRVEFEGTAKVGYRGPLVSFRNERANVGVQENARGLGKVDEYVESPANLKKEYDILYHANQGAQR